MSEEEGTQEVATETRKQTGQQLADEVLDTRSGGNLGRQTGMEAASLGTSQHAVELSVAGVSNSIYGGNLALGGGLLYRVVSCLFLACYLIVLG